MQKVSLFVVVCRTLSRPVVATAWLSLMGPYKTNVHKAYRCKGYTKYLIIVIVEMDILVGFPLT